MTLRQKQSLFVVLVEQLLGHARVLGYEITFGDAARSKEEATRLGFAQSLHTQRLAIDLNLFKNGRHLTSTVAYTPLGEYWEMLNPLCRWGGRFTKPDGNHFSITHGGKA